MPTIKAMLTTVTPGITSAAAIPIRNAYVPLRIAERDRNVVVLPLAVIVNRYGKDNRASFVLQPVAVIRGKRPESITLRIQGDTNTEQTGNEINKTQTTITTIL